MKEEKLIEITKAICKLGGHLWPMVYLSTLEEKELSYFLKQVANSKYSKITLCYAVVAFSYDYLQSKNITLKEDKKEQQRLIMYLNQIIEIEPTMNFIDEKSIKKK